MIPAPVALREPRFRRLWLAQAVSQTGDGLTGLALFVTIYRLSGSAATVGALAAITALPQLAFGLFAGAWVDRWDRRRTMVVCDAVRAPLVAGLILVRGPHDLPLMFALATLQSAAGVLFEPARNALTPALVPRAALVSANSLAQSTRVATGAVGAAAAGVLLALPHGAQWAFGLDALSFAAAAVWTAGLPGAYRARRDADARAPRGILHEIGEGLRVLGSDRRLLGVLLAFAVALLGIGTVNVLFVPFLVGTLHVSTTVLGMVRAAQIVGMVLMGALLAGPGARLSAGTLVTSGMLLLAAGLAALAAASGLAALFAGLLVTGLASTMLQSGSNAYLQAAVPDALRGRVESTLDTLLMVALTTAMATSGAVGQRLGMRRAFGLAAAFAALGGAIARALLGARDATSVLTATGDGDTVATAGDVGRPFAGDRSDRPSPPLPSEELRG
ncbi:MAG TPA: MFS transporter [Candidatus Eisenbacteria bacterium]|nr:MFS transporter [Candidatus Eisenbacteria bacterium]